MDKLITLHDANVVLNDFYGACFINKDFLYNRMDKDFSYYINCLKYDFDTEDDRKMNTIKNGHEFYFNREENNNKDRDKFILDLDDGLRTYDLDEWIEEEEFIEEIDDLIKYDGLIDKEGKPIVTRDEYIELMKDSGYEIIKENRKWFVTPDNCCYDLIDNYELYEEGYEIFEEIDYKVIKKDIF